MRRREFIAGIGGAVAWPIAARAQQSEQVRRVGVLTFGTDTEPLTTLTTKLLREELQKLGWTEGRNLRLDFRFGFGDATKTRVFAADLVQLAPDVIVASYGVGLGVVLQQTKTIPIVFIGAGDPVEGGTVRNAAHPEGNATGFANAFGSLGGKWLELLKEAAPNVTRVLHLYPAATINPGGSFLRSVEVAAQSMQVQVVAIPVSDTSGVRAAIEAFAAEPNGSLLPNPGLFAVRPDELIRLAAEYRLPTISGFGFAVIGGLLGYGSDTTEICRGAATYVGRLLGGAKISDLPVQYPTKFRLTINLKTARALGLEVPPSILVRADEVIERRREFIAGLGGAAGWPVVARGQQGERVRRIGVLTGGDENDPFVKLQLSTLTQALEDLGWTDSRNVRMDFRWAGGDINRIRAFAQELVGLQPDIIVASSTPVAAALQRETRTIPIVFVNVSDPVASGIVARLDRPGGNITGFALYETPLGGKWLELLSEIAPALKRAAIMFNPDTAPVSVYMPSFETAARSLKVVPIAAPVHDDVEIETAINALGREPRGGLVVMPNAFMGVHRAPIISAAARNNVPAVYPRSDYARDGGLLSYGVDQVDPWRRAAPYVDRILRGAKPSELPVQFSTKFELVINLKTAKTLGLTIPPNLLALADEVIE